MKLAFAFVYLLAFGAFLSSPSHAQGFVFSSFQCDPSSCAEQTGPTVAGSAFVSFNSTCTGGIIAGIDGSALARIGIPDACTTPFIAKAAVEQSTTTQLDDFGCTFNLSSVTQTAEILTPFLTVVFTDEQGSDCQGGTSGPTNNGTKPC